MSLLTDGYAELVALLAAATGLLVTDNPATLRPPGILVEPPQVRIISAYVVEATYQVTIVVQPPGDARSTTALLIAVDQVAEQLGIPSTLAAPSAYTNGGAEMPSYTLTIPITYRRT